MELLDQIIYGVRSGKYWFISVAMLFYIASVFLLLVIENKEYKTSALMDSFIESYSKKLWMLKQMTE